MSLRAVIIGLAGALFIAGFGYINNFIIQLNAVELGYLLPVSVIGVLVVWMIAVNPILFRIRRSWAFRPAELAVIVLMMVSALGIPSRGLMEQFTSVIALPAHWNRMIPGWQENKLIEYVPEPMLVCSREKDPRAIEDFITGKGTGQRRIGLGEIPWGKWSKPLAVWLPLAALLAAAVVSLALIVYPQWATRERLRYPIADFITTLLSRQPDQGIGPIYRSRFFWVGAFMVLGIYVVNGLNVWVEAFQISIPLSVDFGPIGLKWPQYFDYPQAGYLLHPRIFPIVIAFAYFLAADVSFTLGISQYLMALVLIPLIAYGVPTYTDYMAGGSMGWHRAGAYVAFTLILVYMGRRYYWDVLRQAVTFRARENVEPYIAWACRILILSVSAMATITTVLGLAWTLSLLTFLLMMVIFLCVSRIAAETGLFFIHSRWVPMGMLLGLLGAHAFGPQGMLIVGLLSAVLCLDPCVALMPFVTNGLKVCENTGVKPRTAAWLSLATYVPALALAAIVVLWANYNYGVPHELGWNFERIPVMAFNATQKEIVPLKLAGTLTESVNMGPIERLVHMRPSEMFLWSAGTGFGLVLLTSFLRLRFNWWPIHPILFLVVATHPMARFNLSFLIGWALKSGISRWGGTQAYFRWKPFMVGMIAGDLLGTLVFMITGAIYYMVTGTKPPQYHAFGA